MLKLHLIKQRLQIDEIKTRAAQPDRSECLRKTKKKKYTMAAA